MAIDTGKILNISAKDYIDSKPSAGVHLYNYDLVGVHSPKGEISDFAALVPDEAEAVVNYQHNFFGTKFGFEHHQMGVALIPKKK